MVNVQIFVGVGAWKAIAQVQLVAAPHVGDQVVVFGRHVACDRVTISDKNVVVEETMRRFTSEAESKQYFDPGDR